MPINSDLLHHNQRRLNLICGSSRLELFEHIGVLRWLGLDGVVVRSPRWPPYIRSGEMWEQLQSHCTPNLNATIPRVTVGQTIESTYPGGSRRYTKISPSRDDLLEVTLVIDYPGVGRKELHYVDSDPLDTALLAYFIGWPPAMHYVSRGFGAIGWPHHQRIQWSPENSPDATLAHWANHRLIDLLGALSVIHPTGLLAGHVESYCSGHAADLEVIKASQPHLATG